MYAEYLGEIRRREFRLSGLRMEGTSVIRSSYSNHEGGQKCPVKEKKKLRSRGTIKTKGSTRLRTICK